MQQAGAARNPRGATHAHAQDYGSTIGIGSDGRAGTGMSIDDIELCEL
ncbi:hypothetical protein ACIPUC_13135 [Streptomyces sp. LARHCF249]